MSSAVRLLLVLLLVLPACRGSEPTGDQSAAAGETEAGPIAEFFGYDEEVDEEQFAEDERRVQELLVACMAEQGFEYLPVEYPEPVEDPAYVAQQEMSPEEYASEYGYGITTVDYEMTPEEENWVDPNQAIVEAMDDAERTAYETALYGEMPEVVPGEEESVEYEGFGGGCQGEASEEVYGGGAEAAAINEELGPKWEELYERIEADPRIVEGNQGWAECMAAAGHDFATQEEAQNSIWDQQNALYEEAYPEDLATAEPAEGEEGEYVEPEIDEAALAELRETEIAVAVADQRCSAEHLPPELRQEVTNEYEQAFLDENRELLEQAREAEQG